MKLDWKICSRARLSRDARFDGKFFIGVAGSGVYCRPICPAPTAKEKNVLYFSSAAEITDILLFRGRRRANRTAVHAATGHTYEELSVESRITRKPRPRAYFPIELHLLACSRS